MAELKLNEERGVEAAMVDNDGPACRAGIEDHDVILQFNGAPVDSVAELKRMLRETPPGRTVTLAISRDGKMMNIPVKLGDRAKESDAYFDPGTIVIPRIPAMPVMPEVDIPEIHIGTTSSRYGIQMENLTPQLGEFFGVKNGDGLLVRSVEKGSPADKAGLKAGDIIVRLGTDKIANYTDWRMAIRRYRSGGSVPMAVIRDRREQQFNLTLPARRGSSEPESELYLPGPDFQKSMNELQHEIATLKIPQVRVQVDQKRMEINGKKLQQQINKMMEELQKEMQEMRVEITY
jgi:C-terminal processing protease CtpA/Prc